MWTQTFQVQIVTSEVKEMHQYGKPHVPDVIDIADNLCQYGVNALFKRSNVLTLFCFWCICFPSLRRRSEWSIDIFVEKKSDSPRRRVKQNGDIVRKHFMAALQPQSPTVRVTALKHWYLPRVTPRRRRHKPLSDICGQPSCLLVKEKMSNQKKKITLIKK